jgi:serine/threonine-protein kinase
MAPELVRRKATGRSVDIFAFGVTAFEICTFELPWVRGTTGMAAMTHDRPPTDIRSLRPNINLRLAKAIHACIEPDPMKRCASIDDFLRQIDGVEQEDADPAASRE